MRRRNSTPFLYPYFVYMCGLFLFLEWLYPLEAVTDTGNSAVFIIFAVFCFLISLFQINWWIVLLLKGIGLLFIVHALYIQDSFFSFIWLKDVWMEVVLNTDAIWTQQWYRITDMFRSVLLLSLIWLMSYLIYYWFVEAKRIFLFIVLTFSYITILDTFTNYEADLAIIRTFVLAFIALGVTNVVKKAEQEALQFSWIKHFPAWIIPLAVVVGCSTMIGFIAPKVGPQWPDPVPFIKKVGVVEDDGTDFSRKKVGYGEDDSQLGGSFEQDFTPVFHAVADEKHYWRIETKDVYTGKGWEQAEGKTISSQHPFDISLRTFTDRVPTEQAQAMIELQAASKINKLVYPYGIREVQAESIGQLLLHTQTEAFQIEKDGQPARVDKYEIKYEKPQFSINQLKDASNQDPVEISDRFTQLPDTLPDRIATLAQEITAEKTNRYEKVTAIEQYFNRNGFIYQTENIPIPREEDYVDQFLFDTKRGYCDNYSTSMVVMLRTLDIPARWVKGFTGGDKIGEVEYEDEQKVLNWYEITNANAHSWVEVYFPLIGWVPFEPTQGFNNLTDFYTESESSEDQTEVESSEPELPADEPIETSEKEKSLQNERTVGWGYLLVVSLMIIFTFLIAYRTRFRWQTKLIFKELVHTNKDSTYEKAYLYLLKVLQKKVATKRPNQTLREYAMEIDEKIGTGEMEFLTNCYEQILYNDKLKNMDSETFIHTWQRFMKRIV
ncbi:transglutaminaseTgpA domain-containing protein [Virgibacillus sp. W0430]|uniref:DUF4129 domain-containing transglutaminase family protein n=1 Tax=Virgibacillus sp. W0430 TaxID=3391580 RepID=UPI003F48C590